MTLYLRTRNYFFFLTLISKLKISQFSFSDFSLFLLILNVIKLRLISNIMLWLPLSSHLYSIEQHFLWHEYNLNWFPVFHPLLYPFCVQWKNQHMNESEETIKRIKLIAYRLFKVFCCSLWVYFTLHPNISLYRKECIVVLMNWRISWVLNFT